MANVFEFLKLPPNHRTGNKIVQLVKHYKEVPASKKGFPLIGQVKKDGVFGALVVADDGRISVFGRTGKELTSCAAIINNAWVNSLAAGVYIGEILSFYKCSLEQLSGVVNPSRVNDLDELQASISVNLFMALHDHLTLPEFILGHTKAAYPERESRLIHAIDGIPLLAEYRIPSVKIYDESSMASFTKLCIDSDEEGAVYKHMTAPWVAGHKGFHVMKDVRIVAFDLECIGYEEGEGKYAGKVANLIFKWRDGQTVKAMLGKGWTHESAGDMFNIIKAIERHPDATPMLKKHNLYPIGKVYRVKGLADSSLGKIRLPKVEEHRHDKDKGDY